jgi:hypothetical protein
VFVIFQRLHPRDAYPGTGIGLAMCRKIIEYHGGRIWIDAEYAAGARVRFTLPMVDGTGDDDMNAELLEVLLVEDDPGDVLLVRESFEDQKVGNVLSVVSDGVEALQYHELHANAYITKPVDYADLAEVIRQLTASFLGLITLPPNGPAGHPS